MVVGPGLAGSLLALALARRGRPVILVGPSEPAATSLSYGGLARSALGPWRELERRHGPLGCRRCRWLLQGWPLPFRPLPASLRAALSPALPFAQVDGERLAAALPPLLERAGVERRRALVRGIEPLPGGGWQLIAAPEPGEVPLPARAGQVVLAAGAGSRRLWPPLPEALRFSWAGVIELDPSCLKPPQQRLPWLAQALQGAIVQPWRLRRTPLEGRAAGLEGEEWIVDGGLALRGARVLMGQITLVGPALDPDHPPEPATMERRLRQGLAELDPRLAALPGLYRQVAVPYCLDGQPLMGPVHRAPGLWVFTGFRGAFTTVPPLAEDLAEQLVRDWAERFGVPATGIDT